MPLQTSSNVPTPCSLCSALFGCFPPALRTGPFLTKLLWNLFVAFCTAQFCSPHCSQTRFASLKVMLMGGYPEPDPGKVRWARCLQPRGFLHPHRQGSPQRARLGMDRPSTVKYQPLGFIKGNASRTFWVDGDILCGKQHFSYSMFRVAPNFPLQILNVEMLIWVAARINVYVTSNYSDITIISKPGIAKLNNLLLNLIQMCSKVELIPEQPEVTSVVTSGSQQSNVVTLKSVVCA